MTTFREILSAIEARHIPLHVAVELSEPGALVRMWSATHGSNWERGIVYCDLLLLTRPHVLFDSLEAFGLNSGHGRLERGAVSDLIIARRSMSGFPGYPRSLLASTLRLLMRDMIELSSSSIIWALIESLGPPTLEEILEASMRP